MLLGSGRFLCKRVDSLPKVFNARPSLRNHNSQRKEKIVIPKRIERGPTDILKALSLTVGDDPTAYDYKFIDDPYLYPDAAVDKKIYALAKESGIKSAEWIIKENPKFFQDLLADPPIKAYEPEIGIEEELVFTEKGLLDAIERRNVLCAIEIYEKLEEQRKDVQESTKQSLLELVCFYNSEEKPNLGLEEKWLEKYLGRAGAKLSDEKKWKKPSFAQSLYEKMNPNCPLALSALIQGMIKYNEYNTAMKLFEKATAKKIVLSVGVYNSILYHGDSFMKQRVDYYDFVRRTLTTMFKNNVRPNLGTLNGALKLLSRTNHANFSLKLIKEFLNLEIEPSLGSYGLLFRVIGNVDPQNEEHEFFKSLTVEILTHLENKEHEILHPCDLDFFTTAAHVFVKSNGLKDPDLAVRIHDLYLKPGNKKFIVKGRTSHTFYKDLVTFYFEAKPIDFAMNFYRRYAFTVFTPDSDILKKAFTAAHQNLSSKYLAEIWNELYKVRYNYNRALLALLLDMMKDMNDEIALKVFHEAANCYLKVIAGTDKWISGDENVFPDLLLAFMKNDDESKVEEVLNFIKERKLCFTNMVESTVKSIFEYGMTKNNTSIIVGSLNLAYNEELPSTEEMVEKALPLLRGVDEAWAKTIMTGAKEFKKSYKIEKENPVDFEKV